MKTLHQFVRGTAVTLNFFLGIWWVWQPLNYVILGDVPLLSWRFSFALVTALAPWLAVIALSWRLPAGTNAQ